MPSGSRPRCGDADQKYEDKFGKIREGELPEEQIGFVK